MATAAMGEVIQHLRRTVFLRAEAGLTDAQLLDDYISRRDEAALDALVRRHGPMVWCVCRRVLANLHDAEDAFQATFLVFVRKAASVASRELLANWLYGVAYQTARKARATAAKRLTREIQVAEMPEPALEQEVIDDLQPLLDQELSQLSDKYRTVLILCDLEGKTRKEAARQLRCPEGTVASRLATARTMLAKRMARHGLAVTSGTLAAVLAQGSTSAGVPTSVASSTIKAATLFAAGQAAASAKVVALTEGVLKAMLMSKLKAVVAVVLALGLIVTGATVLSCRSSAAQGDKPPIAEEQVNTPQKQEPDRKNEAFTAWGKEISGLHAGLGYRPGEHRAYSQGETVRVVARIRNVGKEAVDFKHIWAFFVENPPKITDADGKMVQLPNYRTRDQGLHMPRSSKVAPGKEVELYEWTFDLQPNGENSSRSFIHGTGKFSLQCERIVGPTWFNPDHPNPTLSKLATGKLKLEIKSDPPATDKKKSKQKQEESLTAWGKEVGGVQAGLGYRPGEKRAYNPGETLNLVVRVRNIGKQAIRFQYFNEWFYEDPPAVVDGDGKPFPFKGVFFTGERQLVDVNLAPGKEVELCKLNLEIRSASEKGKDRPWTLYDTGKFQIQYEKLGGNIGTGEIKFDPFLRKLATGKLELEVKEAEKPPQNELPKPKGEKKKVYTPDEVMLEQEKARGKAIDGSKSNLVTVEFKVQAITKPTEIKVNGEKDSPYVVGHGPDDVCLHPQPPRRFEEKQFTAILTSKALKQLPEVGIQDVGKHLIGKTIRVSGRINQHNYSGDEPPIETHYDLVIEDVSQFETVD